MRQTYYGVDSILFEELEEYIKEYIQLTKEMFNKELARDEKLVIKQKKDELRQWIQTKLLEGGSILGFLTEEQVDELHAQIQSMDEKLAVQLNSNFIAYSQLEELILVFMEQQEINVLKNLTYFLEKAKQKQQHVIVWIM
ncbi:hypothetical protein [Neobacillus sp. PS2-9]|uniref:hypothetical protein n=1 Tax=Neobacillus sp. PS2-9 TaxID=3070676 RepID=UPI0027DEC696|nr:hypothetical protein [Neobacillus sp. PS2-9]WML58662.1 hypothetical protein RCG25_02385 [Neobacillus sp. PS2-9]